MARNMLSETPVTAAFAHFRSGPNDAIHSSELRPVFESLPGDQQDWIRDEVTSRTRYDHSGVSKVLGVETSVAIGLITLLHPDA